MGWSVAGAGDTDGDGYGDLVVGAPQFEEVEDSEGLAVLYRGTPAGLEPTPAWRFQSNQVGAYGGYAVAPAGDANGDGYADVLVGSLSDDDGEVDEGRAALYLGGPAGLSAAPAWSEGGNQEAASFGRALAGAGDVNGDGFDDVVVGAYRFDDGQTDEGQAYAFHGGCPGPPDADGDAIGDACDRCAGFDDAADADGDGVADGCDLCPAGPDGDDADVDGVADACDSAPADPTRCADTDGDGCDDCANGSFDPTNDGVDSDGDGVCDGDGGDEEPPQDTGLPPDTDTPTAQDRGVSSEEGGCGCSHGRSAPASALLLAALAAARRPRGRVRRTT
jgi:hypothetical protein